MTARAALPTSSPLARRIFAAIRRKEILVTIRESFSTSVQQFIRQAADDLKVLAIAAPCTDVGRFADRGCPHPRGEFRQAGPRVVVEIKARFDEENNIERARKLEQAGVHVVYGIVGLKTHCKLASRAPGGRWPAAIRPCGHW